MMRFVSGRREGDIVITEDGRRFAVRWDGSKGLMDPSDVPPTTDPALIAEKRQERRTQREKSRLW